MMIVIDLVNKLSVKTHYITLSFSASSYVFYENILSESLFIIIIKYFVLLGEICITDLYLFIKK